MSLASNAVSLGLAVGSFLAKDRPSVRLVLAIGAGVVRCSSEAQEKVDAIVQRAFEKILETGILLSEAERL